MTRPRRADKLVRRLHDLAPNAVVHLGDEEFDVLAAELGADVPDRRELDRALQNVAIFGRTASWGTGLANGKLRRAEFTIERPNGPITIVRDQALQPREERITWWPA